MAEKVKDPDSGSVPRWKRELKEWTRSLFYGLLFVFFFTTYLFKAYKVEGTSMMPLLNDGERIFVNRYVYLSDKLPLINFQLPLTRDPNRGDVVVFWYPSDPTKYFIKRVIAVEGDKIYIRSGQIFVNDTLVDDSFVPRQYRSYGNLAPQVVKEGYYFCVGDHRNRSYDSRHWGLVPRKYIIGKAFLRYWPIMEMGVLEHGGNGGLLDESA